MRMNIDIGKAALLAILILAAEPGSVLADSCGDRVSALQASIKGLALKQRARVTSDFDAFYLENQNPSTGITVSCGPKVLSFDAEWSGGSLATYGKLLKQVSGSLSLDSDDFLSALKTCWSEAELSNDDEDETGPVVVPTSRGQISCVDKQGKAEINVSGPSR